VTDKEQECNGGYVSGKCTTVYNDDVLPDDDDGDGDGDDGDDGDDDDGGDGNIEDDREFDDSVEMTELRQRVEDIEKQKSALQLEVHVQAPCTVMIMVMIIVGLHVVQAAAATTALLVVCTK